MLKMKISDFKMKSSNFSNLILKNLNKLKSNEGN